MRIQEKFPPLLENTSRIEELAWQVLIISVFRQAERQTLNLIISTVGVSTPEEASILINHIFRLIRKGYIYIPEARLKVFQDSPELVDVYLLKNFNETMKELAQELKELRFEAEKLSELSVIPKKVLIDLKNYAEGKYV
ncbi:MAG: hypothetical protein ACXAC8_02425 [Candidatus Hodarchaeales archaeon]|jgi:hypothetical protein